MAFTEAQLVAQIDPASTGRVMTIIKYMPSANNVDVYVRGVVAPWAGRARHVQIPSSQTAAQAWATIKTAMA